MATNLSSIVDKKDKLALYINDVRRMGIELLPPEHQRERGGVHRGGAGSWIRPQLRSTLTPQLPARPHTRASARPHAGSAGYPNGSDAIKNVGRPCIEAILKAREEEGPFADFSDFIHRICGAVDAQTVSRTALECLIKAGALDSLAGHRAQLLAALEPAMAAASTFRREQSQGQGSLFEGGDEETALGSMSVALPAVPEMSKQETLALERDLLGVYVSDHPLKEAARALRNSTTVLAAELPEKKDREEVTIGGIISQITHRITKDNRSMANVIVEDMTGPMTVVFFPRAYEQCKEHLEKDRIVVIKGRANVRDRIIEDDDTPAVVEVQGEQVTPIETRRVIHVPSVHVRLRTARRSELMMLRQLFAANPGDARLMFHIHGDTGEERVLSGLRSASAPS